MLVLARREGESVVIDGEIVVTILEIRGNQIRLGIGHRRKSLSSVRNWRRLRWRLLERRAAHPNSQATMPLSDH